MLDEYLSRQSSLRRHLAYRNDYYTRSLWREAWLHVLLSPKSSFAGCRDMMQHSDSMHGVEDLIGDELITSHIMDQYLIAQSDLDRNSGRIAAELRDESLTCGCRWTTVDAAQPDRERLACIAHARTLLAQGLDVPQLFDSNVIVSDCPSKEEQINGTSDSPASSPSSAHRSHLTYFCFDPPGDRAGGSSRVFSKAFIGRMVLRGQMVAALRYWILSDHFISEYLVVLNTTGKQLKTHRQWGMAWLDLVDEDRLVTSKKATIEAQYKDRAENRHNKCTDCKDEADMGRLESQLAAFLPSHVPPEEASDVIHGVQQCLDADSSLCFARVAPLCCLGISCLWCSASLLLAGCLCIICCTTRSTWTSTCGCWSAVARCSTR